MKKGIICYDLVLVPEQIDINELINISDKTGYLFYDSFKDTNAKPPYMLNPEEELTKVLIDVSTDEGKLMMKKLKDEKIH